MSTIRAYRGETSTAQPDSPLKLPQIDLNAASDPAGYLPDEGLVDAVNVALMLQQPLLLTGEPGTGKTQLAFSLARELELDSPLVFETKSTSISKDLFYRFDNLRRFQAAHIADADLNAKDFLSFDALGLAILRTCPREQIAAFRPDSLRQEEPQRSVVLIDEVDKAPRDFPNDVLNEIENLYFRIPELGGVEVRADPALRPVIIMTSNSEKSLPDAFLRRCIYYNIPFPDEERLERIVLNRVMDINRGGTGLLRGVLNFFDLTRRDTTGLRKKPGTAELLNWTTALLGMGANPSEELRFQAALAMRSLSTLAKHPEDYAKLINLFKTWVHKKTGS